MVLCTAITLGQVTVQDRTGGYALGSAYNKLWSANIITINGKVTGKLVVPPMKGMADAVALTVKQPNKTSYEVHLGPQWFVQHMPIKVNVGDNVIVTGSRVKLGDRMVIFAQSITVGKREIAFRDKRGIPTWITAQVNVQAPPATSTDGEIIDRDTVTIDGVDYNVYRIDTGTGTLDIVGEPTWLSNRQTTSFQMGQYVNVIGLRPPRQIAPNLYYADSFFSSGTLIVLRPPWGG
ncbi:MAG: hypothetical protein ACAH95_16645 [Fimbriimonas sp.]